MEAALGALYRAVQTRLRDNHEEWADRAWADLAASPETKPYVVYGYAGGGEINVTVKPDAEIVLTIQCVAADMATAQRGAGRISDLFNDADAGSESALGGGPDWIILNTKQEQAVHFVEMVDKTRVHHSGHRFRFRMEAVR